ncbi:diguanylate cyclase (GGDEF) domain-containing protein [Kushneria avicenniae]|uniref:diguanylate cyclase n=1 Tax=Kushneria avicenniae TaxID=402385 RepID=A0A1I1FGV0_9GAMM|nr:GGDEF domain-containing protein [Kushneria avicenniae]SFB96280.1 diguanylate cyclase (GGDEF) domain-containing protein [Kushneria avicenniae]
MLDPGTLYFSSAVSRGAYLAIFLVLALRQREAGYQWHWIGAILASLLGSLILFDSPVDKQLSTQTSIQIFTLYMASLVLSWSGLRRFYRRDISWTAMIVLIMLPSLPCLPGSRLNIPTSLQVSVFFICAAFAAALAMFQIIRSGGERLWSQLIVALAFAGYCISFLIAALLLQFNTMPVSSDTAYLSMLFDQVTSILVYVGYIAMSGERANLKLRHQADTDPLTGLFNRRGFQRLLHESGRSGNKRRTTSIVIGDLDHFKTVNDTLGHEAGDAVLTTFAGCLTSILRKNDMAVRWGGEEFLMVLADTDLAEAGVFAERLREMTESHAFQVCGERLSMTISIGIAEMDSAGESIDDTIQRADRALYCAKHEGRNRVCHERRAGL